MFRLPRLDSSGINVDARCASEDHGHELNNRVARVSILEQEESSGLIAYKSMWTEKEYATTVSGADSEM